MRRFPFVQLDVFSAKPLEGNPLAVFTDGRGLSDGEMQALAREMNLSETTFILPRSTVVERSRGVRVRIFTPEEELPFAGHPTLGTAMVLRNLGRVRPAQGRGPGRSKSAGPVRGTGTTRPEEEVLLDLKVGRIPVTFREEGGKVFGEMRQRDPEFGSIHDRKTVARLAGLKPSDIVTDPPIQTVSTGAAFAIVPVKSLRALSQLRLDWKTARGYLQQGDARYFYFVTRETQDPAARLHARMIFSNGEDPATGSAAGCAAAWMVRHRVAQPDERVLIEQGLEAKRPSRIFVGAGVKGDRVVNVRVGGYAVEVLRGEVVL